VDEEEANGALPDRKAGPEARRANQGPMPYGTVLGASGVFSAKDAGGRQWTVRAASSAAAMDAQDRDLSFESLARAGAAEKTTGASPAPARPCRYRSAAGGLAGALARSIPGAWAGSGVLRGLAGRRAVRGPAPPTGSEPSAAGSKTARCRGRHPALTAVGQKHDIRPQGLALSLHRRGQGIGVGPAGQARRHRRGAREPEDDPLNRRTRGAPAPGPGVGPRPVRAGSRAGPDPADARPGSGPRLPSAGGRRSRRPGRCST
jgi:hypothetical protein